MILLQIAFAHVCDAKNMGEFARAEFCRGCDALGVSTTEELIAKLPNLRRQLDDASNFESIYNFVFAWACPKGKKLLDLASASAMWGLLFSGRQAWPYTAPWCQFLEEKHGRPINADTWRQLLQFRKVRAMNRLLCVGN